MKRKFSFKYANIYEDVLKVCFIDLEVSDNKRSMHREETVIELNLRAFLILSGDKALLVSLPTNKKLYIYVSLYQIKSDLNDRKTRLN